MFWLIMMNFGKMLRLEKVGTEEVCLDVWHVDVFQARMLVLLDIGNLYMLDVGGLVESMLRSVHGVTMSRPKFIIA